MTTNRNDPSKFESTQRKSRVVVSMKNVKPLTQEQHQRLESAARDPKLTSGRQFPKL